MTARLAQFSTQHALELPRARPVRRAMEPKRCERNGSSPASLVVIVLIVDRHLQPPRPPAQRRARGLERHRRAAAAAHRSGAQPGRDREGLCGARAQPVRGGARRSAPPASRRATSRGQAAAEQALQGSLGRLMAVAEAYPELKADKNFLELQDAAGRDRGPAPDGAALLQRHGAQPQHQHPVVSRASWWRVRSASARSRSSSSTTAPQAAAPPIAFPGAQAMTVLVRCRASRSSLLLARSRRAGAQSSASSISSATSRSSATASSLVTETIRVQAEGSEIRRGILPRFPDQLHRARTAAASRSASTSLSVTRNGQPEDWTHRAA